MTQRLTVGISTCPNDTFAFHGLMTGAVRAPGLELAFTLADVEELNRGLLAGAFDLAKGSYAAALELGRERVVLPAGSALGFGVGPLLLGRKGVSGPETLAPDARVLCPGEHTTATMLYRMFHAGCGRVEQVVFSEIMPALEAGEAELGVCIHEGRFTWRAHGLERIEDLGERWERETGAPLPLGGLFARRSLPAHTLRALSRAVSESIEYGLAHRPETLATMRAHAQELADEVIFAHVDLYVNEWTRDLGPAGRDALAELSARARAAGLAAADAPALEVLEPRAPARLFHLVREEAWSAPADRKGTAPEGAEQTHYAPPSLCAEGFVHLSFADQVAGTLEAHFADAERAVLVEVDARRVAEHLRLEVSRGGARFPHLYRALEADDLLRAWPLTREGRWSVPRLDATDAAGDVPPGRDDLV